MALGSTHSLGLWADEMARMLFSYRQLPKPSPLIGNIERTNNQAILHRLLDHIPTSTPTRRATERCINLPSSTAAVPTWRRYRWRRNSAHLTIRRSTQHADMPIAATARAFAKTHS